MKIWLTLPFADSPQEIEPIGNPSDARIQWVDRGLVWTTSNSYREGVTWHRTFEAAALATEGFRKKRIADAAKELARLTSLPQLIAA